MNDTRPPRLGRSLWLTPLVTAIGLALLSGVGGALFVLSGAYDIGADAPHTKPVLQLIETLRDRSIDAHARGIAPPDDIAAAQRIDAGAALYAKLCVSCHLGPGVKRTDLSRGLYPKAPPLGYGNTLTAGQEFWIIKHGVKLTAMPAWGRTHDDDEIWSLVAFLRQMPNMSAEAFSAATASAVPTTATDDGAGGRP